MHADQASISASPSRRGRARHRHRGFGDRCRQRRRLPRRRRQLEGHRVFDGAILECRCAFAHCRSSSDRSQAPSPPSRPCLTAASSSGSQLFGTLQQQRESAHGGRRPALARAAARPSSSNPVTDITSSRDLRDLLRHRALQALELRADGGGQLAGEPDIAAAVAARLRCGFSTASQAGAERSNWTTYLSAN